MAPPLVQLREIALTFGGTPLLTGADLSLEERDRLCIVGRNGSGKSTFLKILAGLIEADAGEFFVQPGTTIRYLPQEPSLTAFKTVRDYALAGLSEGDDAYQVDLYLEELKIDGSSGTANLSGGEMRRAAIARVLAAQPDILLLDEPTNHLDLPAIEWLESTLRQFRSTLVMISHDRTFLNTLSTATLWIDRGITHKIPKGFSHFEEWRDQFFADEEQAIHKMKQKIIMEEDWLRYGVTARRKRNQKRLQALHDLRRETAERQTAAKRQELAMQATDAETSGKIVIEAKDLSKAFGDKEIFSGLSMKIPRGDRLAIIGPNGAGKTTMLKTLLGEIEADNGVIKRGANLEIATLDQQRDTLKDDWTLKSAISQGSGDYVSIGDQSKHIMSYLRDFLFRPEQANTPISALSGGERGRVMLARALSQPANLMVLDEPTNDLDIETLDLLQELLSGFDGTLILVSHDRDFVDRVASSTLAYEGNGKWQLYAGGYSDMMAQRSANTAQPEKKIARVSDAPNTSTPRSERQERQQTKLTYKEEHALKTLPGEIEKLEGDIAKLNNALGDPSLYERSRETFEKYSKALQKRQEMLESAEMQWLELEEKRETLAKT